MKPSELKYITQEIIDKGGINVSSPEMSDEARRVMEVYDLDEEDAKRLITKKDKKRKQYHNYHCQGKWGDSRLYDLSINSSRLGIDKTVDMLEEYIKARIADEQNKH